MSQASNISRRAWLFAAASSICLAPLVPAQAQVPGVPAPREGVEFTKGKRLDHSRVLGHPVAPNVEREGAEFRGLTPSAVSRDVQRTETPPAPQPPQAVRQMAIQQLLDGTTFESGRDVLLPKARETLNALADKLRGLPGLRFEIVGHTDNQRISQRLKAVFADNQALSEGRARAVAAYLADLLKLPAEAFAASGKGEGEPVASNDTPEGMAQNRRTVIRAIYEEVVEAVAPATPAPTPAPVTKIVRQDYCAPAKSFSQPVSISFDGQPVEGDTSQVEADRQRCVDVALERADIQVKYDPFNVAPALNVWAVPGVSGHGREVAWRTYTNYAFWLKKAEIRVFVQGQGMGEEPFAVVPVDIGGEAAWTPPANASAELAYVLRVYDDKGRFDETAAKPLSIRDAVPLTAEAERKARDDLSGYGQSSLKLHNIAASGGAVTISGEKIAAGQSVTALGMSVPIDANGKFVVRQILPAGPQKVVVAVKDAQGQALTFERNLNIADKDWFYIAMADITAADGKTTGPAQLVTGDTDHYDKQTTVDGRLAFYLKGKILGKYLLTASADTREQPLKHLFSNFDSKDPNYLLRRIDPNRYYPVYGDDSTIVDDAPTQGKFFVRLERDATSVMWGNFQTSWTGTELTQYSRGLYGGDLIWKSQGQTGFGERRTTLEAFAAEPGTLQSREEFRGTNGSLFYLRRQDLTQGSERLWVEVRDRDSGIVLERTLLTPSQDYDINYLQGRLTLRSPLPSVADGSGLLQTSSLNGNPVYLVATYEYVPGLTKVEGTTVGVRASHWLSEYLRVGGTYYHEGDGLSDQTLGGGDFTLRYKPGTWLKGEYAHSKGMGDGDLQSLSGGFDFSQNLTPNAAADAYRLDMAVNLAEVNENLGGRITAYVQDRQRGFSAPGLVTPNGEALKQQGFSAVVPVAERAEVAVKVDNRDSISQGADSEEAAVRYKLNAEWGVSAGVRRDDRQTPPGGALFTASPTLSRYGDRTDAIVRVDFRPLAPGQSADTPMKTARAEAAPAAYGATDGNALLTADANGPAGSLLPSAIGSTPGVVQTINDPSVAAGVAAARVAGLEYRDWTAYGFVQQTLARGGNRPNNNRGGVGGSWQATDRIRLAAEGSGGSGGVGGKLAGEYSLDDRSNLYLTYARETEVPDQNYAGRQGVLTFGGRSRLTDQIGVFAETRAASGEGPHSLTNGFGVDFTPAERWTTGVKFETGRLSDPISGDLKRNAVSLNVGYKNDRLKVLSAIEYRKDKTNSLGIVDGTCPDAPIDGVCTPAPTTDVGGSSARETVLLKNSVSYQVDPDWRVLGVLNISRSSSSEGAFYDGDYTEAVAAAAYRPIDNDRWNTLFKYTYFYNLPSSGQVDNFTNSLLDYTQRSHVLNVDTIYDLRPWLSVGLKYGLRVGELRDSRVGGDWFSSRAQLGVVRLDLHLVKEWDAVAEWRELAIHEADDRRSGALIGVYRHLGEHGKLGVGYNFTDFSDDLTDLSYRSRGFFINALATF